MTLAPAASVYGVVMPLTLNAVPLAVTAEMLALALPVLLMVSDLVELVPAVMLPKSMVVGFAANVAAVLLVAVKFTPVASAELMVTLCEAGLKVYDALLGVTLYVPFCRPVKLKLPDESAVVVLTVVPFCARVTVVPPAAVEGLIAPEIA